MVFVPSVDGISHAPGEYTAPQGLGKSSAAHLLLAIDRGALDG